MESPAFQTKPTYDHQQNGRGRGFRGTAENAKTKICMRYNGVYVVKSAPHNHPPALFRSRWKSGHCRFGDQCNFAHGEEELRSLPPRDYNAGRGRAYGGFEQHQRGFRPSGGHGGGGGGVKVRWGCMGRVVLILLGMAGVTMLLMMIIIVSHRVPIVVHNTGRVWVLGW